MCGFSGDPAAKKLLDAAQACLLRLAELADLEQALRGEEGSANVHRLFLERVNRLSGPLLEALRDSPAVPLMQPLRQALRLRWRAVLSLVMGRGDDEAWPAAFAGSPSLFALDVEAGDGRARLAHRQELRELLAAGRYQALARRLASWSRSERVPERLARLWSLELWAWEHAATGGAMEDEIVAAPSDTEMHDVLLRLVAMAGEIEQRFPAEQRPEVARFLRTGLFDLFETVYFCDHFLAAAAALLRHLPDDPGLLGVAVTAAVCAQDHQACAVFASLIAARTGVPDMEQEPLLRLIPQLAHEPARHAARILPLLRPLLEGEAWSRAVSAFAQRVTNLACSGLRRDDSELWVHDIVRDIGLYRTALPDSGQLAVLDAAVRCLRRAGEPRDLRQLLERTPGLAPALVAVQVLVAAGPLVLPPVRKALEDVRETAIERLDADWRVWRPALPDLVIGAEKGTVRKLRKRLQQLLRQRDLGDTDRKAFEEMREQIQMMQSLEKDLWRDLGGWSIPHDEDDKSEESKPPRPRKSRRRAAGDDLQPELLNRRPLHGRFLSSARAEAGCRQGRDRSRLPHPGPPLSAGAQSRAFRPHP